MAHFVAVAGFDALPSAARIEFADIYDDATERLAARLEDEISARQSFAWAPVLAIARFVVQGPVLASGLTGAFETVRGWVNPAEPSNLT
jgi:hypothetical protein